MARAPGPVPHGQQVGVTVEAKVGLSKLARLSAALAVRDLLDAIGARELYWVGLNLQEAGRVEGGEPWQIMAPLTLRLRPQRRSSYHFYSPYQTLLQQSMTAKVDPARGEVKVGTQARYASEHHFGVPSRNLPARRLLPGIPVARDLAVSVVTAAVQRTVAEVNNAT